MPLDPYGALNAFLAHRSAAREALNRAEMHTAGLLDPAGLPQDLIATKRTVADVLDRIVTHAGLFGGPDFPTRVAAEAARFAAPWEAALRGDYAPAGTTAAFALANGETNPRYDVPKRSIRAAAESILAATHELRRHAITA